jgi:uncharacterized protein
MSDRDRDAAGRAHNSRPRDGLGRPLAHGARGEPTMPEHLEVDPQEGVRLAQELLDEGRPFHAHEVFEALWKSTDEPRRRELWQGLAQLAVGLTHEARGNTTGAASLVQRGRDRVAGVGSDPLVDVPGVVAWADGWLAGRRGEPPRVAGPVAPPP